MLDHVKRSAGEFVEFLRTSPIGQQFIAERRREVRLQRQTLIAKDRALQEEERELLRRLEPALKRAEATHATALATFVAAAGVLSALRAQRSSTGYRISHDRGLIARELATVADDRIGEARGRIDARFEQYRRETFEARRGGGAIDDHQEQVMTALVATRARLTALQGEDVEDLDAAIVAIERSIPWGDTRAAA